MAKYATINQHPVLSYSQLNRDYFFPDILNGDVKKMQIPSFNELAFIGRGNVNSVRLELCSIERTLRANYEEVNQEKSKLDGKTHEEIIKEFASEDGHIHCDWCGVAHEDVPENERENMSYEEWDKATRERLHQTFNCKFGPTIAKRCHKVPSPTRCDGICHHADYYTMGVVRGSLVDNAPDSVVGSWQNYVDASKLRKCPQYAECHGDMPFKDKTCIFENNFSDVKLYIKRLDEILEDYAQRIEFVEKYLANTKAVLAAETLEDKPSFTLDASYHLHRAEYGTVFVFIDWEEDEYTLRYGVLNFKQHKQIPYEFVLTMLTNGGTMRITSERQQSSFKGLCMLQEDFIYLMNHSEYWQVWLQSIDTKGTEIIPEKLHQTLAKLAIQRN